MNGKHESYRVFDFDDLPVLSLVILICKSGQVSRSRGHSAHAEIQVVISREVDDSIKASMQKESGRADNKKKHQT